MSNYISSIGGILTYPIGGVPLAAYLGIGITTVCLATVTVYDSMSNSSGPDESKSFLYELPNDVSNILDDEVKPQQGGKGKKRKRRSAKKRKSHKR
jgi:hypothetical protein